MKLNELNDREGFDPVAQARRPRNRFRLRQDAVAAA